MATYQSAPLMLNRKQTFTGPSSFAAPQKGGLVFVTLVGAGGGGQGGPVGATAGGGQGGGAGEILFRVPYVCDPSEIITVTIGVGGNGGASNSNGSAGSTSAFGSLIAKGGYGGNSAHFAGVAPATNTFINYGLGGGSHLPGAGGTYYVTINIAGPPGGNIFPFFLHGINHSIHVGGAGGGAGGGLAAGPTGFNGGRGGNGYLSLGGSGGTGGSFGGGGGGAGGYLLNGGNGGNATGGAGSAAAANSGAGGGGGAGSNGSGGAGGQGGSGICIVEWCE